jgi:hypothetical protein
VCDRRSYGGNRGPASKLSHTLDGGSDGRSRGLAGDAREIPASSAPTFDECLGADIDHHLTMVPMHLYARAVVRGIVSHAVVGIARCIAECSGLTPMCTGYIGFDLDRQRSVCTTNSSAKARSYCSKWHSQSLSSSNREFWRFTIAWRLLISSNCKCLRSTVPC